MRVMLLFLLFLPTTVVSDALFVTYDPDWRPNGFTLVYDSFEYTVNRNDDDKTEFLNHGGANTADYNWTVIKSSPGSSGANGYMYTIDTPQGSGGECGNFPGIKSDRVLVIESNENSQSSQTDMFLRIGDISTTEWIPADVWFQWWMCIVHDDATDGTPYASNFYASKWLYPCYDDIGSCATHNWLIALTRFWCLGADNGGGDAVGDYFLTLGDQNWTDTMTTDCNVDPNGSLYESNAVDQGTNTWVLVKVHVYSGYDVGDGAQTQRNEYEVWRRVYGDQSWTKTADYKEGTPNYVWTIIDGRGQGHSNIIWPSTSGKASQPQEGGDWWIYVDDFAMATREAGLPTYNE